MPLTSKTDITKIYGLYNWVEYINGLDDKERLRHVMGICGTLIYNCVKKSELHGVMKALVVELGNVFGMKNYYKKKRK